MTRGTYRPEQIIKKLLREAEILRGQKPRVGEAARKIGITDETCYRWPKRTRWDDDLRRVIIRRSQLKSRE